MKDNAGEKPCKKTNVQLLLSECLTSFVENAAPSSWIPLRLANRFQFLPRFKVTIFSFFFIILNLKVQFFFYYLVVVVPTYPLLGIDETEGRYLL